MSTVVINYEFNTKGVKSAEKDLEGLNKKTKKTEKSADNFSKSVNNADQSVSGLSDQVEGLTSKLGIGSSGLDGMGKSAKGAASGLMSMVTSGKALSTLLTASGIGLIAAVLAAAKAWFEYNKNLVEATRRTKALTGLSGDALKVFRSEIQATADTFGVEFNDALKAASVLSKQMGISLEKALNQVNRGLARAANRDEFLEQVKEYPGLFEKAGGAAEDFVNILIQAERSGIYSDALIDSIKEADIKLTEMKSAKDALIGAFGSSFANDIANRLKTGTVTTLEALKEIGVQAEKTGINVQQAATLTADVLGSRGEDAGGFLKVMKAINAAYDEQAQELTDIEKLQLKQLETTEELEKTMASFADQTGGVFEKLMLDIKIFTTQFLIDAINGLVEFANGFIEAYNQSVVLRVGIQAAALQIKTGFDVISAAGKVLIANLRGAAELLKAIFTLDFEGAVQALNNQFKTTGQVIVDTAKNLGKNTKQAFNNAVKAEKIEPITIGFNEEELDKQLSTVNKKLEGVEQTVKSVNQGIASALDQSFNFLLGLTDRELQNLDERLKARKQAADVEKQLDKEVAENRIALQFEAANAAVMALNFIAGKNKGFAIAALALEKSLAIADIIINLQKELAGIAANAAANPANAVTFGAAGVSQFTALSAVAKTRAAISTGVVLATGIQEAQGFKDGVIDLAGPGSTTSDSISAKLSRGESVMTALETSNFKPTLQAIRNGDIDPRALNGFATGKVNVVDNTKIIEVPRTTLNFDENGFQRNIHRGVSRTSIRAKRYRG